MRKHGLVAALVATALPSMAVGQQFTPVLPDSSTLEGVWASAPEVVPPVSRVVGQQSCAQSKASLSNYFVFAGTRLELEQAGPSRFEGTNFRFIKTPYRGKLYYPQGYASSTPLASGGVRINRACHVEIFEYTLSGELAFNVDTAEYQFNATGPIVNAPAFRHGPTASVSSWSNGQAASGFPIPVLFISPSGDEIVLGVGVGDPAGPALPGDCTSFEAPPFSSISTISCMPLSGVPIRFRRTEGALGKLPSFPIHGRVMEGTPDGVPTLDPVTTGKIRVRRQTLAVRARRQSESAEDYAAWLTADRAARGVVTEVPVGADGTFEVPEQPFYRRTVVGNSYGVAPLLYTLELVQAEKEEIDPNTNQPTTIYFLTEYKEDVHPGPDLVTVVARPGGSIAQKLALADRLIARAPASYSTSETAVKQYLQPFTQGQSMSGPQNEGLSRAIWSERAIAEGADLASELVTVATEVLADVLADLAEGLNSSKAEIKEGREELDRLRNERFDVAIASGNYKFEPVNNAAGVMAFNEAMEELLKENPTLRESDWIDYVKRILKAAIVGPLKAGATRFGMSIEEAETLASLVERYILPAIELVFQRNVGDAVREVIKASVAALGQQLIDAPRLVVPFGAQTDDTLVRSEQEMRSWRIDNRAAYGADRDSSAAIIAAYTTRGSQILGAARYGQQASEGFGAASDVLELGGAIPAMKFAAKVTKVGQKISQGVAVIPPLTYALAFLPGESIRASEAAFGRRSFRVTNLDGLQHRVPHNPNLTVAYGESIRLLDSALVQLQNDLVASDYPAALQRFVDPSAAGVRGLIGRVEDDFEAVSSELSTAITDSEVIDGTAGEAAVRHLSTRLAIDEVAVRLRRMILKAAAGGQISAGSKYALKQRIDGVRGSLARERDEIARVVSLAPTTSVAVSLALTSVSLVSLDTGKSEVTATPERFRLTAVLRNVSTASVSEVAAELAVTATAGWITVTEPLRTASFGLAPDDNAASGADERMLSWTLVRTAPLDAETKARLEIRLLEAGAPPVRFSARPRGATLVVDEAVDDADLDGFSLADERQLGLDPAVDDRQGDKDGDGLTNAEETRWHTRVDVRDTDGDGRDDKDEISGGAGGWRTNPLLRDTDGDGEGDATDGAPLDPHSTAVAAAPAPARIRVEPAEIVLQNRLPFAELNVESTDGSTIAWTVVAEDDDALGLSVRAPALSTGHSLTIAREGPRVDPNQKAGDGYRLRFINLSSPVPDEVAVMVWLGRVGTLADAGVVGGDDGSISGRDSGVIGGADGGQPGPGPGGGGETKSGCGCSAGGAQGGGAWAAAGLVLALLLRRRRGR